MKSSMQNQVLKMRCFRWSSALCFLKLWVVYIKDALISKLESNIHVDFFLKIILYRYMFDLHWLDKNPFNVTIIHVFNTKPKYIYSVMFHLIITPRLWRQYYNTNFCRNVISRNMMRNYIEKRNIFIIHNSIDTTH